ncbi:hypothetical protein GJAV_G00114800 [Gymnothorax javanicus]|nr:hypothetical protein GJAV_G00114800 [Gymnothorax javanicus]
MLVSVKGWRSLLWKECHEAAASTARGMSPPSRYADGTLPSQGVPTDKFGNLACPVPHSRVCAEDLPYLMAAHLQLVINHSVIGETDR